MDIESLAAAAEEASKRAAQTIRTVDRTVAAAATASELLERSGDILDEVPDAVRFGQSVLAWARWGFVHFVVVCIVLLVGLSVHAAREHYRRDTASDAKQEAYAPSRRAVRRNLKTLVGDFKRLVYAVPTKKKDE